MKSVKFLEKLQSEQQINITEMAKLLHITQPAMSNILAGRRIMENETCIAVAIALKIDPMKIIMAADMDRAEKTGQKSLWEVFMTRMAATASALLFAVSVNLFLTPTPADAATPRATSEATANNINYAKSKSLPKAPKMQSSNKLSEVNS
ncbi:helix-turn-helix transcriptional regulator [Undibacterium sp.]|uniref:helix-turn-helix domain-containing protein n=1 Tax=Undibacterium sp. TaxID=1914977 RepID=UPI002C553CC5|nr:helix-turn-helix transcriptional regulator [Undibacterium sp.]HTD06231.1 helix-turn-helix transcriptional regulator [Undibacterium sp.]